MKYFIREACALLQLFFFTLRKKWAMLKRAGVQEAEDTMMIRSTRRKAE